MCTKWAFRMKAADKIASENSAKSSAKGKKLHIKGTTLQQKIEGLSGTSLSEVVCLTLCLPGKREFTMLLKRLEMDQCTNHSLKQETKTFCVLHGALLLLVNDFPLEDQQSHRKRQTNRSLIPYLCLSGRVFRPQMSQ